MAFESLKQLRRNKALVALPERTRQLVRRIPEPVQLQMKRYSRRSLLIGFEIFISLLVVSFVAVAIVRMRLEEGPIPLSFLAAPIERAINQQLPGLNVDIENVVLRRSVDGSGVEFRILNLQMNNDRGDVVAQAPFAAIGLSGRSLLFGNIAPGSVDLIGARLRLYYAEETGLALSFSRPDPLGTLVDETRYASSVKITRSAERAETIAERRTVRRIADAPSAEKIDLVKTAYDTFESARRRPDVSTALTRFGFRDALVVFDLNGEQSTWRVPDFSFDLEHKKKRSIVRGTAKLQGRGRDWNIRFRTEQSEKRKDLIFTMLFDDVVPRDISENFAQLEGFRSLDIPFRGQASVTVTRDGDIKGAEAKLNFSPGHIVPPWHEEAPVLLDEGNVQLRYTREAGKIEVLPSVFRWGESRATLSGEILTTPANSGQPWQYSFVARDAVLGAEEFGASVAPVQEWVLRGSYSSAQKRLQIDDYRLILPNGGMRFAGTVSDAPGSPEIVGEGAISAQSAESLKRLWTPFVAPLTRQWIGENVNRLGQASGRFKFAVPGGVLHQAKNGGDVPDDAVSLRMEFSGVNFTYFNSMPPMESPNVVMSQTGRKLTVDIADGQVPLPSGNVVKANLAQFVIDDLRPEFPVGSLRIKTESALRPMLEFLDYKPLEVLKNSGIDPNKYRGTVVSDITMDIPLKKETKLEEVVIKGNAKVRKLTAQNLFGKISVDGGAVDFGLTGKAVDARGDILLNGVPAKISWQRIFGGKSDHQPSVRIFGTFDDAARKQLEMGTEHVLRGDLPVVLTIARGPDKKRKLRFEADLTNSILTLGRLGWRKPAGRSANLAFDIVTDSVGVTEFKNFQVQGDKIGINGWLRFDKSGEFIAYGFPEFSFDVISRMELAGFKDKSGIWKVKAKSSTYDGRQLFRSLFSGGRISEDQKDPETFAKGIDLDAKFDTMIGHFDSTVYDLSVKMKKRNGRLVAFNSEGKFQNGKFISAELKEVPGAPRVITARSDDAGNAFRLVGFFPKVEGGQASLSVDLDGKGNASTVGTLSVRKFVIIGQPAISEVGPGGQQPRRKRNQPVAYQKFDFDRMEVPFSVGFGQFVLHDAQINGPLLGATMRGRIDFHKEVMDLGGTYVPLFGLNAIPGEIPILGEILVGREGEGLIGVTFAVQGPIAGPEVLVNPVSVAAPGIFRQIFEMSPLSPSVKRRGPPPPPPGGRPFGPPG